MGEVVQRFTSFHVDASAIVERPDGSIVVPGQITHPGVFTYRQDGKVIKEYRPESEVFAPESMASFDGVSLTIDHPRDLAGKSRKVTAETWRKDSVGHTRNVRREGNNVVADIVIQDGSTVASVKAGRLKELSCGYGLEVEMTPGTAPDGTRYDAVHRNIIGNHVALLPKGRARGGAECVLRTDGNEEFPGADGADGADGPGADDKVPTLPTTMAVSETEFATLTVRADALDAENKQLKLKLEDATRLDALVEERAGLVESAKAHKIDPKGKTNAQIKAAIVKARSPSLASRADSLGSEALDAAYAAVMEKPAPAVRAAQEALAGALGGPPAIRHDAAGPGGEGSRIREARLRSQKRSAEAFDSLEPLPAPSTLTPRAA